MAWDMEWSNDSESMGILNAERTGVATVSTGRGWGEWRRQKGTRTHNNLLLTWKDSAINHT